MMRMLRTVQIRLCAYESHSESWSRRQISSRWQTRSCSSMISCCMSRLLLYEVSLSWVTEVALSSRRFGGSA